MVSAPPPIIMGELIWKFAKVCQNFVGTKFFLTFVGDKPLWGELKLYGGVIFVTTLSLFHLFRNSYPTLKSKLFFFMNFFSKWECIRSCCLPTSWNLLKKSFRKTSLLCLLRQLLWKKCYLSRIFQTIIVML